MKDKLIKFLIVINFYLFMIRVFTLGSRKIFLMEYKVWMNAILFLVCAIIVIFSVYQIVSKRFNFKYFGGRSFGIVMLTSLIFITPLFYFNAANKLISSGSSGQALAEKKQEFFKSKSKDETIKIVNETILQNSDNIKNNYKLISEENLYIYHDVGDYSGSIDIVKEVVDDAKTSQLSQYLNEFEDTKANIIIVNDISNINNFVGKDVAAYFDPLSKDIVVQSESKYNSMEEYKGVIFHEFIHYAVDLEREMNLEGIDSFPKWFDEGLATYLQYKYYGPEAKEVYIVPVVGDITEDSNFSKGNPIKYYAYSRCLLEYMLQKGGDDFVINLFEDMKTTNDIYTSIENVLGESLEEIRINMM